MPSESLLHDYECVGSSQGRYSTLMCNVTIILGAYTNSAIESFFPFVVQNFIRAFVRKTQTMKFVVKQRELNYAFVFISIQSKDILFLASVSLPNNCFE